MIQNKSKRSTSTSILTTHISAVERRRRTLFLSIPGRAMLAEIAIASVRVIVNQVRKTRIAIAHRFTHALSSHPPQPEPEEVENEPTV